jgi:hypothetical protein
MRSTVQARLDRDTQRALDRLVRRMGWSASQVVREGVRLVAACYGPGVGSKIAGLGKFSSGQPDLGSNKAHLKGFGR